ncbi:MAG: hypothetical protein JW850_24265 [Thermoflexales bacterium]|nr:hypothetical protein [Thermoflexales bacterium]
MKSSGTYLSYLLRLWRSGPDEQAPWRASLECPLTGERQGFANLRDLFAFLESVVHKSQEPNAGAGDSA